METNLQRDPDLDRSDIPNVNKAQNLMNLRRSRTFYNEKFGAGK